jgi:hypothetical protein
MVRKVHGVGILTMVARVRVGWVRKTCFDSGRDDLMISDLMTWENTRSEDDLCPRLFGVTLKVPIGEFSAGTLFFDAMVDFENGILTLSTYDGFEHIFEMEVVVR